MSSDLTIPRVGAAATTADGGRSRAGASAHTPVPLDSATPPPTAGKVLPNPALRLDYGLAIVVIEFRDETGAVRSTIPTQQQLEAYRTWDRGHIGEAPHGAPDAGRPSAPETQAMVPKPVRDAGHATPDGPPVLVPVKHSATNTHG